MDTRKRALQRSRCHAINRKKNPPELSVRFSVHAVASMAIEARWPRPEDRVTVRADQRSIDGTSVCSQCCCYHCRALSECNDVTGTRNQPSRTAHAREPYRGLLIIRFFLAILPCRFSHPLSPSFHPVPSHFSNRFSNSTLSYSPRERTALIPIHRRPKT